VKRRPLRERDEAAGREQAERRLDELLARVRDREAAARARPDEAPADPAAEEPDPIPHDEAERS
jgi:hypothetical protein